MASNNQKSIGPQYTTHGAKRKQGQWARVNDRIVFAYVEGKEESEKIIGYTPLEEMMITVSSVDLPEYQLDF